METFRLTTLEELAEVATKVLAVAGALPQTAAVVLALKGDLGSGKTTFTQTLARALGVTEPVTSPTFVIMKGYELEGQIFDTLIHIDAYRLETSVEMTVLGFANLIATPRILIVIEWAEKISDLLPEQTINLTFNIEGDERVITLNYG
ncbi:MAG: tRNA (adenosine(37)-N6)-threonylcarbamoyltransferase complex ATPase subunit type 1 TsaE [Parcubacteria group bacterium CG2_30_44_11]|nr:MAG: tRNA (adenosine(37)-N6)-threonylcarbamoyltransferase complex ATPase subunit type 1 TsaE [Parcubacteria group bacterium CG2_30_44_11]